MRQRSSPLVLMVHPPLAIAVILAVSLGSFMLGAVWQATVSAPAVEHLDQRSGDNVRELAGAINDQRERQPLVDRPSLAASSLPSPLDRFAGIFEERFVDNRSNWPDDPSATAWFTSGEYHLFAREPGQFVAVTAPTNVPLRDGWVTAQFRKVGGPPGGGYGLIVRDAGLGRRDGLSQGGHYYVFEAGDRGEFGAWRREEDRWVEIIPWTPSSAVRAGSSSNTLTVFASGDRLKFQINGTEVADVRDSVLTEGTVGILWGAT